MKINRVKNIIACLFFFLFLTFSPALKAQELETPLYANPVLKQYIEKNGFSAHRSSKWDSVSFNLDTAAFFDDFSYSGVYPSSDYWLDNDVFINSNGAFKPPSLGTAVFDGLNFHGMPYNPGTVNSKGNIADKLTSVPIDLSRYQEKDSIYLSFFYQPQGLGDMPESYDSLVLEFKPDSFWNGSLWQKDTWVRMWSIPGSALKPFSQVIIHVPMKKFDSTGTVLARFYHKRFQFRFANYGNLSGNLDHWHIDYVKLNKNRNMNDIYYNDIAANYPPVSLLKTYYSMPWKHLLTNTSEMRTSTNYYAYNLKNNTKTLKKIGYSISDTVTKVKYLFSDSVQAGNIRALSDSFYKVDMNTAQYSAFYSRPFDDRTVLLKKVFGFSDYSDDYLFNDTSRSYQIFENYYAYDDGTPEAGYGIANSSFGQVAYHFKVQGSFTDGDSLRGVAFFFNQAKEQLNKRTFKIMVWKDYTKEPLLEKEAYIDGFNNTDDNGFVIFEFDSAIYIAGDFYIGWEQNADFYMNVGVDKNYYMITGDTFPNKANPHIYYNYTVPADWNASTLSGALMIRPYITDKPVISSLKKVEIDDVGIRIYPNPARDELTLIAPGQGYFIKIYDVSGRLLVSEKLLTDRVSLKNLEPGLYLLTVFNQKGILVSNQKIIKVK